VFDHVTVRVSDIDRTRSFYELALGTLGLGSPDRGGHFFDGGIYRSRRLGATDVTRHLHIGLAAPSCEHVDEFWRTLTEQNFGNDGRPGLREKYRAGYYGAFVLDPDS
jgi:catechol 2,3-dioxygenase-like lactoylglutathione lyase family enzyme